MKDHGGDKIIKVASVSGIKPDIPCLGYSVSKTGVIMATKCMAVEWAPYKIRVNCIAPGPINTHLFNSKYTLVPPDESRRQIGMLRNRVPLKRIGEPHEIADAMVYFAANASSFVTGQTIEIDGGLLLR